MPKTRVLIVDDSVVIRRLLTDILTQDPELEVAGTAPNGKIALSKLPQLNPDLVTLDIEMPEMDGLVTLPELRKAYPKLPVIMFSTLTERGAVATLDALARGATDYVTKPANVGSVAAAMQSVKEQLIPKIKSLCPPARAAAPRPLNVATRPIVARPPGNRPPRRCDVVVIGSSTGGPMALATVIGRLPAGFPVPVVVVQHMPPVFTRHLATRLNQDSPLDVTEAVGGEALRPGQVLIAPGDFHLELVRRGTEVVTALHQGPPENSCRPAVDVLFRSAAGVFGAGCLAVVLTGMGQDGLRGGQHLTQAGGTLLAQDEASSVVWGMPRAVTEAGLASATPPLSAMADELIRRTALGRRLAVSA
ncbi:MAG: chemotaxis response regulator protein-glutamate methylesterase [Pirellulaceae bacterium]|nr:chemotaxis response regulator protein-glutamate methylesterase [Pirellulaceae bacterium]